MVKLLAVWATAILKTDTRGTGEIKIKEYVNGDKLQPFGNALFLVVGLDNSPILDFCYTL